MSRKVDEAEIEAMMHRRIASIGKKTPQVLNCYDEDGSGGNGDYDDESDNEIGGSEAGVRYESVKIAYETMKSAEDTHRECTQRKNQLCPWAQMMSHERFCSAASFKHDNSNTIFDGPIHLAFGDSSKKCGTKIAKYQNITPEIRNVCEFCMKAFHPKGFPTHQKFCKERPQNPGFIANRLQQNKNVKKSNKRARESRGLKYQIDRVTPSLSKKKISIPQFQPKQQYHARLGSTARPVSTDYFRSELEDNCVKNSTTSKSTAEKKQCQQQQTQRMLASIHKGISIPSLQRPSQLRQQSLPPILDHFVAGCKQQVAVENVISQKPGRKNTSPIVIDLVDDDESSDEIDAEILGDIRF